VSWLTLRSVEREAKRLEVAERDARRIKARDEEALRRAQEAAAARADQTAGISVAPTLDKAPDLPPTIDIKTLPATVPAAKPRQAPVTGDRSSSARPAAPPLVITPPSVR